MQNISNLVQITHQNPDAEQPLIIPVLVLPNTPEAIVDEQIRQNSRLHLPWLSTVEPHGGVAVICGGGPSLSDSLDEISALADDGGAVFGLNAASILLSGRGIPVEYQVIIDAKQETSCLVDMEAGERIYASGVHPDTAAYADILVQMNFEGMEGLLPPEKVAAGGYALVGGGVSVGITALCVAYTLGFRTLHLFGYDSSDRDGATHAYAQPMNALIPKVDIEWAGRTYRASMPMKLQAEAFPNFARALQDEGCTLHVHGDGLLPAMWHQEPMTEREKYQLLWADDRYRHWSPGESAAATFIEIAKPDGTVIDFGCGTGRGGLAISEATGQRVVLLDFTDNSRDVRAGHLQFIQWDLTKPIPIQGAYGYCTDVMEHIPPGSVVTVVRNIMAATPRTFFQIATAPDKMGSLIGQTLHLTVQDYHWWRALFARLGYEIEWSQQTPAHSSFYVINPAPSQTGQN